MSDCQHEGERCCSPETVYVIRSNRSVGMVPLAPIRETGILRPKMYGLCNDDWDSRLQKVQSNSEYVKPVLLIETAFSRTSGSNKRQNPLILLHGDGTFRTVRRKGDTRGTRSSGMQIAGLANLSKPIAETPSLTIDSSV